MYLKQVTDASFYNVRGSPNTHTLNKLSLCFCHSTKLAGLRVLGFVEASGDVLSINKPPPHKLSISINKLNTRGLGS